MLCIDQKNKSKNATNDFNLLEKQNLKGDKHDLHLMRYREIVILVCMEGKKNQLCSIFFSLDQNIIGNFHELCNASKLNIAV